MSDRARGVLLIAAAALFWSTGGIGIKGIADAALKVSFYRSLFAAATLFLIFRREAIPRRWTSAAFLAAVVCYAGCLTTFVVATKWTTAANAIFLQYAGAIWVLLLSPAILKEPLRRNDVAAIVVAIGGMALFFVGRFETRGSAGNWMALVSSFFFAGLILALRREHESSKAAVVWGNVLLSIVLLPVLWNDLPLTTHSLLVLVLLGIFQIGVAYALFVRGLKYVSATQASLTGMLEPVANPLWVFLFLHERPSVFALAGGAIVLAAIAGHTVSGSPSLPPLQPAD